MSDESNSNFKRNAYILLVSMVLLFGFSTFIYLRYFTQEAQNRLSRTLQNWTGVNGTLEVYAHDGTIIRRYLEIDKFSTAKGTEDGEVRPYRYAWGIWDKNLNGQQDEGEIVGYFEIPVFCTYIFSQEKK